MESTGIYHELLAKLAHKRGLVVYVLNPKDTRHYAKAMGLRGKTDRVDAELIAGMIAHKHANSTHGFRPPPSSAKSTDCSNGAPRSAASGPPSPSRLRTCTDLLPRSMC